jgi:hypothetical protein
MLAEKARWQGGSVVRDHHIAGMQEIHNLGPGLVLDITPTVSD